MSKIQTVQDIASFVDGHVSGDHQLHISSFSEIVSCEPFTITFLANPSYEKYLYQECLRAVLVPNGFVAIKPVKATLIYVTDVYIAWQRVLNQFFSVKENSEGIHDSAVIDSQVVLGENISIGACSVIKQDVKIGDDTIVMAQVYIGKGVLIGKRVLLFPGVRILDDCIIGDNVIIQSNTVIGSDGFGYSFVDGKYSKIPHKGNVVIEEEVEIGANVCVDRAAIGSTIIRKGAKLDNLIQVAHNVAIGHNVAIAAQAGISGSSIIGAGSQLGGQAGIAGHLTIAEGSKIQAQSGVSGDIVSPHQKWYGYPVLSYWKYLRSYAIFKSLPQLKERLDELEKRINEWTGNPKD